MLPQFKMKPEMHYGEKDCPVAAPDNFPKDSELHFEIELIEFSKVKARVLLTSLLTSMKLKLQSI